MTDKKQERELYRLTYAIDGVACHTVAVERGARLEGLFRPSMPHATFDGWGEVPARMPGHDLTLDGHFTRDRFRVIFAAGVDQYGVVDLPAGEPLKCPGTPVREGYDFVGWQDYDGIMPACNRTYEAIFTPCSYQVTYVVDDLYRFRISCPFGAAFPRLAPPRKHNHVFSGWSEMPEKMPAEDVTITGRFEVKRYRLTRIVDDEVFSEEYLPYGAPIDRKVKPVREGYSFSGWRKLPATMPARDLEIVTSMYPTRYQIQYYLDSDLYHAEYIPFGERITPPAVADRPGMLFGGWDDLPETMPARDVLIQGSLTAILYRLSFEVDGEEIDRRDLTEGAPIPQDVKLPNKPGYAFCGWENEPQAMPARDLTLHAIYAAVQSRYVFMIDGKVYAESVPRAGETVVMPRPESDERPFSGWSAGVADPRTGVTTFYGSYTAPKTYCVRYFIWDEEIGSERLPVGTPLTPPVPPRDETYEFVGWKNLPSVMPAYDLVVMGDVKQLKYTLEFEVDGEIVYSMSLDAGSEIACPALAPRAGYSFAGWQDVPAVMPAEDLVIHGSYRTRLHTVTYLLEGKELARATLRYGESLTPPEIPAETAGGREFAGWAPVVTRMPDHDITIEGAFTDTICLVTVYIDGVPQGEMRAVVGMPIALPHYPSREGMHFVWQDVPSRAPAGHLDIHGGYIKNEYTVTYFAEGVVLGQETYLYGAVLHPRVEIPESMRATFLGWKHLPEKMPARDLHVDAQCAERTYHLTFRLDGRVFAEMDVPVGAPTPSPDVPEREGYQFDGWRNYVSVMPPYNFTAYGTYSRRTYKITYLVGKEILEEQNYVSGAPIVAPIPPVREKSSFRNWEGLGTHMPSHDMVVSARYSGVTYRISYVVDGTLLKSESVEFGARIVPHTPARKEGVTFTGWHNLPEFMPAHEVIATGSYETRTHTVTYKVGGVIWRIDTYEEGETIVPPTPPEHAHESFVTWRNLALTMPSYDFVCTAEYSEDIGHYSFVVDGEVLSEGSARRGEMLTPPTAPHRSGFAFTGWSGFTGVMPGGDAVYIGSYATDTFKVRYYLDDEAYCEAGFHDGERIVPADPPELEGYTFSGWQGLPSRMPSDDLIARGYMIPNEYRLIYRADGRDIVYEEMVPCGTPLGRIEAPEKFGHAFSGWTDEPATMPPHSLTISGVYRAADKAYRTLALDRSMPQSPLAKVAKGHPKEPRAVLFFSGSYVRLVVDHLCYPIPVPTGKVYVRNNRILDPVGLGHSLRRVWKKYCLPASVELVLSDSRVSDVFYEAPVGAPLPTEEMMQSLFPSDDRFGEAQYQVLSLSTDNGGERMLISRCHRETCETMRDILAANGVTLTACRSLAGALTAYLQPNKRMERGKNQICLYYLPNALVGILMVDGRLAALTQNEHPFEGRDWNVERATEEILSGLIAEGCHMRTTSAIRLVAVGGIDRTHVRDAEKFVCRMLKQVTEHVVGTSAGGLFGGIEHWKKPSLVRLGYGNAENRTK